MTRYLHYLLSIIILIVLFTACSKTGGVASTAGIPSGYSSLTSGPSSGSSSSNSGNGGTNNQPGVITAGEWNDINNWNYWLSLMDTAQWNAKQDYWKFYTKGIYSVHLTDTRGAAITDADVSLKDAHGNAVWTAKTDNSGKAELFPVLFTNATPAIYSATATVNGQYFVLGSFPSSNSIEKQLDLMANASGNVDVMYVVDATGSMGDELSYLKTELEDVLVQSKNDLPGMTLRMGSVFYRDQGDEYLTKSSPFTTDVNTLINFIKGQNANGGGDFPEAVHAALQTAVEQQSWSSNAKARLLFLVLDAPPHHEDAVIQSIQSSIKLAAQKGIKIIPITASGIDKDTEFMMRFMAISTNGTYVFIINDSGIGNDHLSPTVGKYEVEFLNNLMVRLIKKYSK
ncbi:MAG: VWA domain-containing protein [Bacteroidota bacterium]